MNIRRCGITAGLALLLLFASFESRAEVSAQLDELGQYQRMFFNFGPPGSPRVWTAGPPTFSRRPLNPTGDVLGDLGPSVAENRSAGNWPLVVWLHRNGPDYDLVYSRWTGASWAPIAFVQADNMHNEFDPRPLFNSVGRPYLVWWSDEGGRGAVYFSFFLESRWMTPVRVSLAGEDARRPEMVIESDLAVRITYDTFTGRVTRYVTIPSRDTITDDIDPKIRGEIVIQ